MSESAIIDFCLRQISGNLDRNTPEPDIAHCSSCGNDFNSEDCPIVPEGDYESGYYDAHVCPECPDGGCIDDYSMSDERAKQYEEYYESKDKR